MPDDASAAAGRAPLGGRGRGELGAVSYAANRSRIWFSNSPSLYGLVR